MGYISQKILAEHAELEEAKKQAAGVLWKASKSKIDDFIKKIRGTADDAVKKADDANKIPDPWDDAAKKTDDVVKSKADDAAKTVKSKADDAAKKADDAIKSKADDVVKKADDVKTKKPKKPKKQTKPKKSSLRSKLTKAAIFGGAGMLGYHTFKGSGDEGGGSSGSTSSTQFSDKLNLGSGGYEDFLKKSDAASARGAGKDYRRDIARGIRSTSPGVFTKSDSADDPKSSRTFTRPTTTSTTPTTTSTPSSSGKYVSPDLETLRRRAAKATMVGPSPEAQKLMSKKALAYFGKDRLAAATKAHQNIRKPMLVKEMTEQKEAYDVILEYLLDNGHADTINEANYIMLEMDSQSIQTIVEMGNPSFDIRGGDPRKAAKTQKINKAADAGVPNAAGKAKGPILPGGLRGV